MIRTTVLASLIVIAPIAARADCPQEVAADYARARALPPTPGRAALLEQIQRAEIAHHEGDEDECVEAVGQATEVLNKLDAASHPGQASTRPSN